MLPSRRALLLAAVSGVAARAAPAAGAPAGAGGQERLAALEVAAGGRLGVAALNTADGAALRHRADERFAFCSTFKLLAVSAILRRSEAEPGLLDRRITYTRQDLAPYSPVTARHVGKGMTVAAICAAGLEYSDNTAANLMIRLLGGPGLGGSGAVTAFARSIGDEEFRLDRWETALNSAVPGDPRDTSTPAAMMNDLRRLALGTVLDAPQRERLVGWMRGCRTGSRRIRAGLPGGWTVADKTGSGDYGTSNDIAVAWPPGKPPIVLAIYFTQTRKTAPWRDDVVASAARIVAAAFAA